MHIYIYICKYPFFRWFIYSHMSNTCSFPSLRTETVTFTTFTIPFLPWGYSQSVRSRESSHPVTIGSMKHQETPAILPIYPVLPPEILQYTVHLCSTAWCCPTAKFVAQKIWQQDKKERNYQPAAILQDDPVQMIFPRQKPEIIVFVKHLFLRCLNPRKLLVKTS